MVILPLWMTRNARHIVLATQSVNFTLGTGIEHVFYLLRIRLPASLRLKQVPQAGAVVSVSCKTFPSVRGLDWTALIIFSCGISSTYTIFLVYDFISRSFKWIGRHLLVKLLRIVQHDKKDNPACYLQSNLLSKL
jgi:hypothetical protein